ncbi:hypothetical protein B0H11DRAFT_84402 [Mycena galericulata]|nr:hypothetical protein B0H11DRAFT_84402 [Mycena galericulata]
MDKTVRHPFFFSLSFLCSDFPWVSHLHSLKRSRASSARVGWPTASRTPSWRSRKCMNSSRPSRFISNGRLMAKCSVFFPTEAADEYLIQIIVRGRTDAGDPELFLQMIVNDRYRLCSLSGEFLDAPIRPRFDTAIADIDPKYFILHKFVGDIVWICGGPEPVSDDDEDDEEDKIVSDINIGRLLETLRSPAMDLVPREQEMMFGSCMVLVQKDTVWDTPADSPV